MKSTLFITAFMLILFATGCSSSKETGKKQTAKVAELVTMPSGLKYYELKEGTGKSPKLNQKVTVQFKISTEEGYLIEDTYKYDQPLTFTIGNEEVIKGLEEGLLTMKPGGKRKLIIPPELGFGNRAIRSVPANSNLVCELELIRVE